MSILPGDQRKVKKEIMANLVILQQNLGKGNIATSELRYIAASSKADFLLIQEPALTHGPPWTVAGFGTRAKVITGVNTPFGKPLACILIFTEADAIALADISTPHCACAEVTTKIGTIYLISWYCQPSRDFRLHCFELSRALEKLRGRPVIIGADVNASSMLWSFDDNVNDHNPERGEMITDLISYFELKVQNMPGNPRTFQHHRDASDKNIDITLTSKHLNFLTQWKVTEEMTTSDHRVITIKIFAEKSKTLKTVKTKRFNVRKAKWDVFTKKLNLKTLPDPITENEIDNMVREIQDSILNAASKSIPRKKFYNKSVPWWTKQLTDQKKGVNKLRQEFQKEADQIARLAKIATYRESRRQYTLLLRKTRLESWRRFVTQDSLENPYGFAYKFVRDKIWGRKSDMYFEHAVGRKLLA